MNEDMAKPDYEQLCKEYEYKIEELNRENEKLKMNAQAMEQHIQYVEKENVKLEGRVAGLEFAIRCNGVSGSEVIK